MALNGLRLRYRGELVGRDPGNVVSCCFSSFYAVISLRLACGVNEIEMKIKIITVVYDYRCRWAYILTNSRPSPGETSHPNITRDY